MAKGSVDTDSQCREIIASVRRGEFAPVYLLMGEEPYYTDLVTDEIIKNAFENDSERDFNQTICYGSDLSDADAVITAARRYPMFAERQLVVVKEAQLMKGIEDLSLYCAKPLDSTVLVVAIHGKGVDKRKAFYKSVSKIGVVVESNPLRDYEMPRWITSYYSSRGLSIAPDAASLLAEYAGTDLSKIALETDKLLKSLPEGSSSVSVSDIEENVGISRQFSIFELTSALSAKNAPKALSIAAHIGSQAKFAMPMATSALFSHFYRILKYGALLMRNPNPPYDQKAKVLGVLPFFMKEYDLAVRNYPLRKAMSAVALIKDYDFKGKGGDNGEATDSDLIVELTMRLLNL